MNDDSTGDYMSVESASNVAGISPRTLRYWIKSGKLAAVAGKRGKLVRRGDVERLAALAGKGVGNDEDALGNPARSADGNAGNVAETALVSEAARQQLATIRDEWLAPLIDKIGGLERDVGRLEAERDQARREADDLRARLEAATTAGNADAIADPAPATEPDPIVPAGRRPWWRFWG